MIKISPSILAADFSDLKSEIKKIEEIKYPNIIKELIPLNYNY